MFHETLTATFQQPKLVAVNSNHEQVHDVRLKFECDFSDGVAAGIGALAKATRKGLLDGEGGKGAMLEINGVACNIETHVGTRKHVFKNARGVKATAKIRKPSKGEDEGTPRVVFEFQVPWQDGDVVALAHAFGKQGAVRIEKMQLSLMDGEGEPRVRKGKK